MSSLYDITKGTRIAKKAAVTEVSSYRVVFEFPLMQVDDVGAHAVQEVLGV